MEITENHCSSNFGSEVHVFTEFQSGLSAAVVLLGYSSEETSVDSGIGRTQLALEYFTSVSPW